MVCVFHPFSRSWLHRRQIDGSLNRTPHGFYDHVWQILERTPNGIMVAGVHLPQVAALQSCSTPLGGSVSSAIETF